MESNNYQRQDLIDKIERVDKMVKLHSDNPSSFMLNQYKAKKEKLVGYLNEKSIDSK
jgi:ribosomal protein S15P/S13E